MGAGRVDKVPDRGAQTEALEDQDNEAKTFLRTRESL